MHIFICVQIQENYNGGRVLTSQLLMAEPRRGNKGPMEQVSKHKGGIFKLTVYTKMGEAKMNRARFNGGRKMQSKWGGD